LIDLFGGSEGKRQRLREGGEVNADWAFTDAACSAMFKALDCDADGRITLVRLCVDDSVLSVVCVCVYLYYYVS